MRLPSHGTPFLAIYIDRHSYGYQVTLTLKSQTRHAGTALMNELIALTMTYLKTTTDPSASDDDAMEALGRICWLLATPQARQTTGAGMY
jgi:hypothetical protein